MGARKSAGMGHNANKCVLTTVSHSQPWCPRAIQFPDGLNSPTHCAADTSSREMEAVQVATLGIRIALEDITASTDPALISSDSSQSIQITSCHSPPPPPVVPMQLPSPSPVLDAQDMSLSPPQARDRLPVSHATISSGHQHESEVGRPRQRDHDTPAAENPEANQTPAQRSLAPPVDVVRISASSLHPPNASPTPSTVVPPSLASPRHDPPPQPHAPAASTSSTPPAPFAQSDAHAPACDALPLSSAQAEPSIGENQPCPIDHGQQPIPSHPSTVRHAEAIATTRLDAAAAGARQSMERHPSVVRTSATFPASHASTARAPVPPPPSETGTEVQPIQSYSTAYSTHGVSLVAVLPASPAVQSCETCGFTRYVCMHTRVLLCMSYGGMQLWCVVH